MLDVGRAVKRLRRSDPRQLGGYELLGRLGAGGMGVVYLARGADGRRVAVKAVHARLAGRPEFRARFRGEVERARQVPSFCTAEVLDADPDHDPPYLVVEYVDGPSVTEAVERNGPLSAANLHATAIGVASALAAIHGAGVVHRDLKPGNVLLAPGSPKVIDFGIARALEGAGQGTVTGQLLGTVAYMAPERFSGISSDVGPAADVFAWGAVVAYAGLGHVPFPGRTATVMAAGILHGEPDLDGLPAGLRNLVAQALSKHPDDRPTARELLDRLLEADPRPAHRPPPTVHTSTHRSRRRIPTDHPAPPRPGPRTPDRPAPAQAVALVLVMLGLLVGGIILVYADRGPASALVRALSASPSASPPVDGPTTHAAQGSGAVRTALGRGRCLASRADGRPDVRLVEIVRCVARPAQIWQVGEEGPVRTVDGCLGVSAATAVVLACDEAPAQQWRRAGTGELVHVRTGLCLEAVGDPEPVRAVVATCGRGAAQRWQLPDQPPTSRSS